MDIKPFLHEHYLLIDQFYNEKASCDKCHGQIHGWAYSCESCPDFWLHLDCAQQQLPPQISHPLHTQHLLNLSLDREFICSRCFTLSRGNNYQCKEDCDFVVDVLCAAASTNDATLQKLESRRLQEGIVGVPHFVHEHRLAGVFNYRKVGKRHLNCGWCEKHLSGMIYGCFECEQDFFFHESCLNKIPTKLLGHPFHSSHPLYIQPKSVLNNMDPRCNACKDGIIWAAYSCRKCDFNMHALCSRIQPSLKHEIQDHTLTYFQLKLSASGVAFLCKICDESIYDEDGENNFYRCVQCDFNFHFECLEIPSSITHRHHMHALILFDRFKEDYSGEYYCDTCEEERNAQHNVYGCEECTFVSHIQCALNKVDSKASIPKLKEQEEREKGNAESQSNDFERQIEHFTHLHPLSYHEIIEKGEDVLCKACNMEIYGQAYGCRSCKYYLHNQCAKLPYELLHPLHPQHPLQLLDHTNDLGVCYECKDVSFGLSYICYLCSFVIDMKCVTSTKPSNKGQRLKEMARESKCPFNQDHELSFWNLRQKFEHDFLFCSICLLPYSGVTYTCSLCGYVVHESCLGFPLEIAYSHSEYTLHPSVIKRNYDACCAACRLPFRFPSIISNCEQNENIKLHLSCANALRRGIGSMSHPHPFSYFGTECQKIFASNIFSEAISKCHVCNRSVSGVPFYRCLVCDINVHLECVPIPRFIKSKCHIHPFTLRDCFVEDDSGEHYCDICERERHPKDHVYFCEECQGLFVAHIECVFPSMEEEIASAEESSSNPG